VKKLAQYYLLLGIVTLGLIMPWLIHRHVRSQSERQHLLLEQQAARLAELLAQSNQLRHLANQTSSAPLTTDQFRELLRLRGEIGPLRQCATEAAALLAREQKLFATERELPPTVPPPEPQTVLAYWPKEQLTSAGYATPAAAIQSALWSIKRNDPGALAASLTPETRATITNRWLSSPADAFVSETRSIAESIAPASGFYVLPEDLTPKIAGLNPDLHILNVYFENEGATRGFGLRKINDQWQVEGIYVTATNALAERGQILWP
jgi:hypothetical protein